MKHPLFDKRRQDSRKEESGAVLILALAFLAVASISVAAILSNTEVNLKMTTVTRDKQDLNYASDAGLEWGIQNLRNSPDVCQVNGGVLEDVGTVAIDGVSVNVKCRSTAGSIDPGAGHRYAVVTTESGPAYSLITNGPGTPVVNGEVFANGPLDIQNLSVQDGDFKRRSTSCVQPGGLTVASPYSYICNSSLSQPQFNYRLPDAPPIAFGSSATTNGCTIYYPGKYDAVHPMDLSGGTGKYYLASGVYYFLNTGPMSMGNNTTLLAGSNVEPLKLLDGYGCDDALAKTAKPIGHNITGDGVEMILGGNSGLIIGNQTKVELNSRKAAAGDTGSSGVSIYGVESTPSKPGWATASATSPVLQVTSNSNTAEFTSHGVIFAPNSPVEISATNNTFAAAQRGVVARALTIKSSNSISGEPFISNPGGDPVYSTPTIVFVATATKGSKTARAEAVVDFYNNPDPSAYTSIVKSWRTVGVP